MTYTAPVDDIMHALKSAAGLDQMIADGTVAVDGDTLRAVIEEAGKFGANVLEPLNWSGDREGSKLVDGSVHTPKGWKEAYKAFADGGWTSLPCDEAHGGQGLPQIVAMAVGRNLERVEHGLRPLPAADQRRHRRARSARHAEQKRLYLAKMVAGAWTGTMNLTEPHAGSDLGHLRAKAEKQADGTLSHHRHQDLHHLR